MMCFYNHHNIFISLFTLNYKMEYHATFGIDGGVSHGLSIKYPDFITKHEIISADDEQYALIYAIDHAINLSREHLSNPDKQYTKVTILNIKDSKGNSLNPKKILPESLLKILNGISSFGWDGNKMTIKCSTLEHLVLFALEQRKTKKE